MSDTTNEVRNLPDASNEPAKAPKKKKEKKKGGFWGKFLCLILGFFLGICSVFGTVAGIGYFVATRPLDDTVNTVDELTGADLYGALFGSTDSEGNFTAGILNEKYAEAMIGDLLGDVGEAVDNLTGDDASLAALNEISPKVGTAVDGIVKALGKYGIQLDTETLLNTPFSGDNGIMEYVRSSLSDIAAGDLLTTLGGETLSPMFLSICYGKENVDYTIDEDGNVTMLGDAKKKTIGELTSTDISVLFDDILLADVMGLENNYDSKIVMRLMYGKEGLHYSLATKDGKPVVTMLDRHIYVANSGNAIYDENEKLLSGASVDLTAKTFTDADGNVYNIRKTSSFATANGVSCSLYNLCDENFNYLKFAPTSIGDLMGEDNPINHLLETITIGEVFDSELVETDFFLKHVKDETIESLPEAIKSLKVIEVYEDEVYEKDGVTLKGSWKYLLTDQDTGKVDDSITITDMQKMIDNMQTNIHTATLFEMKDDGVLSELSDDMLETKLKTSIGGQSLSVTFPGKTKLGDLTVDEMLTYLDHILSHLPA